MQLSAGELYGDFCRTHRSVTAVCAVYGAGGSGGGHAADDAVPLFYSGAEGWLPVGADPSAVCIEDALCDAHRGGPGGNTAGNRAGVLRRGGLLHHAFCIRQCGDLPEQQYRRHGRPDQIYDGIHDRQQGNDADHRCFCSGAGAGVHPPADIHGLRLVYRHRCRRTRQYPHFPHRGFCHGYFQFHFKSPGGDGAVRCSGVGGAVFRVQRGLCGNPEGAV